MGIVRGGWRDVTLSPSQFLLFFILVFILNNIH